MIQNIINQKCYKREPFLFMGTVFMPDGKGGIISHHDPMKLALDFFTHSNDCLFEMYGFNWVPEEPYYSMARKQLEHRLQKGISNNFVQLDPVKYRR